MKLQKDEIDEITHWFNTKLWATYPAEFTKNHAQDRVRMGSKQKALQAVLKIPNIVDIDNRKRIIRNIESQVQADLKSPDRDRWPHVLTYINGAQYDDVVQADKPHMVMHRKECATNGCSEPALVDSVLCSECYLARHDKWQETRKNALIELGLWNPNKPISNDELRQRCRDFMLKKKNPIADLTEKFNSDEFK